MGRTVTPSIQQHHIDEAQRLIDEGWYQTSARYRSLARMPEGKTGVQALAEASGRPDWAEAMGESSATDHFLCVYSNKAEHITVSIPVFYAYKKLGGGSYRSRHWETTVEEFYRKFRALGREDQEKFKVILGIEPPAPEPVIPGEFTIKVSPNTPGSGWNATTNGIEGKGWAMTVVKAVEKLMGKFPQKPPTIHVRNDGENNICDSHEGNAWVSLSLAMNATCRECLHRAEKLLNPPELPMFEEDYER